MEFPKITQSELNSIFCIGGIIVLLLAIFVYFYKINLTEGFEGSSDWELTTDGSAVALQYKSENKFNVTEDGQIESPTITELNDRIDALSQTITGLDSAEQLTKINERLDEANLSSEQFELGMDERLAALDLSAVEFKTGMDERLTVLDLSGAKMRSDFEEKVLLLDPDSNPELLKDYVTEEDLTNKSYVTQQNLENDGYLTKTFLTGDEGKIYLRGTPEKPGPLSDYSTTEDLEGYYKYNDKIYLKNPGVTDQNLQCLRVQKDAVSGESTAGAHVYQCGAGDNDAWEIHRYSENNPENNQ